MSEGGFTDDRGRTWEPDPTGRFGFRGRKDDGTWTDWVCNGPGQPTTRNRMDGSVGRDLDWGTRTPVPTGDRVGSFLEAVGWLGVVASILGALFVGTSGSGDTGSGGLAVALAVAGSLQSLLLVGFGRLISHAKDSRDLLFEAVCSQ